ncbi:MAG: IS66 family transposase [Gammaproteobacteria bacterium]
MENLIKNNPLSNESLLDVIEKLQQEIEKQKCEILTYKNRYEALLEQMRLARMRHFTSSSEKNPAQLDLFDEAGVELPECVKEQLTETIEVPAHTRQKHPVRRPLPADLPREIIIHDLPEAEKVCDCGQPLVRIGADTSEQLKYVPAKVSVIQHVRPKYACKPCQEHVKIAPMPLLLLPKSVATPELVAHVIISKYCDHIPLYRQEAIWERFGIDLPRSSLCGWLLKTAELCEPLIVQLQKNIVAYDYVQVDETTVQVLKEKDRDNTAKSYMWCYRGGGSQPSIVYQYQETRGGHHAQQFLTGFSGFLQSDAFSGYNWAHEQENVTPVGCHAHARRPFAELVKTNKTPGLAHEALRFYSKLYEIEKEAKKNRLSSQLRYELRLEKAKPILDAFKIWLDHHLTKTSTQGTIGKAIRYVISHWDSLINYLRDGRIEIDNNLIENAIRPFALGRKNWLFNGSPAGAKAGATFFSLIQTCKANQIDPYQYFCAMLNRIRACACEEDYKNLLPQFIKF